MSIKQHKFIFLWLYGSEVRYRSPFCSLWGRIGFLVPLGIDRIEFLAAERLRSLATSWGPLLVSSGLCLTYNPCPTLPSLSPIWVYVIMLGFFFLFFFLFFCGGLDTQDGLQDLSSSTRDWTQAPCSGSLKSQPQDHQGISICDYAEHPRYPG